MIGNAVPPMLGSAIAAKVAHVLDRKSRAEGQTSSRRA
jgi:hypothetical protein